MIERNIIKCDLSDIKRIVDIVPETDDHLISIPSFDLFLTNRDDYGKVLQINYRYTQEPERIHITVRMNETYLTSFAVSRVDGDDSKWCMTYENTAGYDTPERREFMSHYQGYIDIFFVIQAASINGLNDVFECKERVAKAPSKPGKKHSHRSNKLYLCKTYTLVKDWEVKIEHKKHNMTCPCWAVRGHYRHYKSGKTVFIRSYTKGKDRTQSASREYVISPKVGDTHK